MALDLTTLAPREGKGLSPRRNTRTAGPNPFLDNGWLMTSFETGKDFEIGPVQGVYIDTVIKSGERKGEPTQKWDGEVAVIVSMLRTAADKLGIGVSIEIVETRRKGQVLVKYLGKTRKVYTRVAEEDEEEDETEE